METTSVVEEPIVDVERGVRVEPEEVPESKPTRPARVIKLSTILAKTAAVPVPTSASVPPPPAPPPLVVERAMTPSPLSLPLLTSASTPSARAYERRREMVRVCCNRTLGKFLRWILTYLGERETEE